MDIIYNILSKGGIRLLFVSIAFLMELSCNAIEMKVSKAGMKFIQEVEQCSLERYWDNDAWSIGYGHHMPAGTRQYKKITKAKALQLLRQDIKTSEKAANKIIRSLKWTPSQEFFDGLVSIIYNCGEGGIKQSVFYKRLMSCRSDSGKVNKNDYNFTIAAVKNTRIPRDKRYASSVRERRYREHLMML